MTKVYLSGPMTGKPALNRVNFAAVAVRWRAAEHTVLSPAELPDGLPRPTAMHKDLLMVLSSQAIVMLDGWEHSTGALVELMVAVECGLPVFDEHGRKLLVYLNRDAMGAGVFVRWRFDGQEDGS